MPDSILIIDDVASSRSQIRSRLSVAQYKVLTASSAQEGLDLAASSLPSVILAGLGLADMPGEDLIRNLRALPGLSRTGIVGIRPEHGNEALSDTLTAGADEVIARPLDDIALMSIVRALIRRQRRSAATADRMAWAGLADIHTSDQGPNSGTVGALVAMITDNRVLGANWRVALRHRLDARFMVLQCDRDRFYFEPATSPDVVVLDVSEIAFARAVAEIAALHSQLAARHAELVVVTGEGNAELAALARDIGASDVISTTVTTHKLQLRLNTVLNRKRLHDHHRDQINESLKVAAYDPLTGLTNRRNGMFRIERMLTDAGAEGSTLAILAVDFDDFKSINDRFGHSEGDTVLTAVADRIRSVLRGVDLFARTGGDEFIIALPSSTPAGARLVADHIRHLVTSSPVRLPGIDSVTVSVSVGIAVSRSDGTDTAAGLIHAADRDMYRAKAERAAALKDAAGIAPDGQQVRGALRATFR